MGYIDLFSEQSDRYAHARPHYPAALFGFIASQCSAHERVWDCGTGNGQAAISLANYFAEVVATDASESQIAHAQAAATVRYSVQPAEQTTFPNQYVDAICVAQALHWFEFERFFAEVRRVAKPGALFAAWGYSWPMVDPLIDATLQARLLAEIEPYWAPQNRLLWDGYVDIPVPFPQLSTPAFQIELHWRCDQYLAYLATWSATRRCLAEQGPGFFNQAAAQLQSCWGSADTVRTVFMPLALRAGRASP